LQLSLKGYNINSNSRRRDIIKGFIKLKNYVRLMTICSLVMILMFGLIISSAFVFGLIVQEPNFVEGKVGKGQINNNNTVVRENESYIMLNDSKLQVELVSDGLVNATQIAFVGPDDILALEKDSGKVQRIVNGTLLPLPLLDVNVATQGERGMLGIAISHTNRNNTLRTYVFLDFTESKADGGDAIGNHLYRYEFVDNKLINPKLLLDLPAYPGPLHNIGAITIGPDNNIYIPFGDLDNIDDEEYLSTQAQNIANSTNPDGRAGILRVTQDGNVVGNGILGKTYPLNLYYAYGIRNSYGIDFDPLTGKLWDTENGPDIGDEINLVEPGFNSGWKKVQGIWKVNETQLQLNGFVEDHPEKLLFDFSGNGKYSAPELTWKTRAGLTSLAFFNSTRLGKEYENDLFVGDFHNGNIYNFKLYPNRTSLILPSPIADKVVDKKNETQNVIFAKGFGAITDLEIGPDKYLYILTHGQNGSIYRVYPAGDRDFMTKPVSGKQL
jgi:glucose/arabinose dehydrogenase